MTVLWLIVLALWVSAALIWWQFAREDWPQPEWHWGPTSVGWVRSIPEDLPVDFEEWADRWAKKPEPSDPQESAPRCEAG